MLRGIPLPPRHPAPPAEATSNGRPPAWVAPPPPPPGGGTVSGHRSSSGASGAVSDAVTASTRRVQAKADIFLHLERLLGHLVDDPHFGTSSAAVMDVYDLAMLSSAPSTDRDDDITGGGLGRGAASYGLGLPTQLASSMNRASSGLSGVSLPTTTTTTSSTSTATTMTFSNASSSDASAAAARTTTAAYWQPLAEQNGAPLSLDNSGREQQPQHQGRVTVISATSNSNGMPLGTHSLSSALPTYIRIAMSLPRQLTEPPPRALGGEENAPPPPTFSTHEQANRIDSAAVFGAAVLPRRPSSPRRLPVVFGVVAASSSSSSSSPAAAAAATGRRTSSSSRPAATEAKGTETSGSLLKSGDVWIPEGDFELIRIPIAARDRGRSRGQQKELADCGSDWGVGSGTIIQMLTTAEYVSGGDLRQRHGGGTADHLSARKMKKIGRTDHRDSVERVAPGDVDRGRGRNNGRPPPPGRETGGGGRGREMTSALKRERFTMSRDSSSSDSTESSGGRTESRFVSSIAIMDSPHLASSARVGMTAYPTATRDPAARPLGSHSPLLEDPSHRRDAVVGGNTFDESNHDRQSTLGNPSQLSSDSQLAGALSTIAREEELPKTSIASSGDPPAVGGLNGGLRSGSVASIASTVSLLTTNGVLPTAVGGGGILPSCRSSTVPEQVVEVGREMMGLRVLPSSSRASSSCASTAAVTPPPQLRLIHGAPLGSDPQVVSVAAVEGAVRRSSTEEAVAKGGGGLRRDATTRDATASDECSGVNSGLSSSQRRRRSAPSPPPRKNGEVTVIMTMTYLQALAMAAAE